MKSFRTSIAICVLAASCGEPPGVDSPLTGPTPSGAGRTPTGSYTLAGLIRDLDGTTLADVPVVRGPTGPAADDSIRCRWTLPLRRRVWILEPSDLEGWLPSGVQERLGGGRPGGRLRPRAHCDSDDGHDAPRHRSRPAMRSGQMGRKRALSTRVLHAPDERHARSGSLLERRQRTRSTVRPLRWARSLLERSLRRHEIRASIDLVGSPQREIRINSYLQPQEFELSASFRPAR